MGHPGWLGVVLMGFAVRIHRVGKAIALYRVAKVVAVKGEDGFEIFDAA